MQNVFTWEDKQSEGKKMAGRLVAAWCRREANQIEYRIEQIKRRKGYSAQPFLEAVESFKAILQRHAQEWIKAAEEIESDP